MGDSKKLSLFEHEGMVLKYIDLADKGLQQLTFNTQQDLHETAEGVPFPNFELAVAGRPYGHAAANVTGLTNLPAEMQMESVEKADDHLVITYKHDQLALKVIVNMEFIPGAAVIRQQTTVINQGNETVTLTHLSSMCMSGIASDGSRPWHDKNKIKLHYCLQTWNGEGQWRSGDLEELGLYPTSSHPSGSAVRFASIGTWSTGRYLPMAIVEDMETNKTWYFQIETSTGWQFEIGHRGAWAVNTGALYLHVDGANERNNGWTKKLEPGRSFTSVPAAVGCCNGDFKDAVRELTKYRRHLVKKQKLDAELCPVIYNDYMNTLWGNPTGDKLLPLIKSAGEAGCEYFCIDAGWFGGLQSTWGTGLGDWRPSTDRFGEEGLQGIINEIINHGMKPGLWLEIEVCGEDSGLAKKPDHWFIQKDGIRVGGGPRWFLNFSSPDVCSYMFNVIDRLVSMGVRYFKNDYNLCMGLGDDTGGRSAADGLIECTRSFYSFIDEVRVKHPDLLIENCGSGAMRSDYGILSHFHLQSSSDQEAYELYPSILCGSLAAILPEQLGIWAYPYPLEHDYHDQPERLQDEHYLQSMADGEQTIFNMINGLCGVLYLSGHLNAADALNRGLIQEAVSLYKQERSHIQKSFPVWPLGFNRINNKQTWASVGLVSPDDSRMLLAVWRLESAEEYQEITFDKWKGKHVSVKQLYPSSGFEVDCSFNTNQGSLTICLPVMNQARYFEVLTHDKGDYGR